MKINVGPHDRVIRVTVGAVLLVFGEFWLNGIGQIVSILFGIMMSVTGLVGFCGLYTICKFSTCNRSAKKMTPKELWLLTALYIALLLGGSLLSIKITQNRFLEDFSKMNGYYKQTLFLTGQIDREGARSNYDNWNKEYQVFSDKYMSYKPYVIKNDLEFNGDLQKVSSIIVENKDGVYDGDLAVTHKKLEEVRPIFQEMFKRNGFSMLAITLTDFHDAMEKLITAADDKNPTDIVSNYDAASNILSQVEAELNDDGVKLIRSNLEGLRTLATENKINELSQKAAELKSSFVKVYLLKG